MCTLRVHVYNMCTRMYTSTYTCIIYLVYTYIPGIYVYSTACWLAIAMSAHEVEDLRSKQHTTGAERRRNTAKTERARTLKGFENFCLKAKARIWS